MLSSIAQVIHIDYDKYMSSGVALVEQRVVELGHVEADLVKTLSYLRIPCSRCLLDTVERLVELTYRLWLCARLETGWLYHVHLLI